MLEQEMKYFKSIQDELKAKNPEGGFAVISGEDLLGVWLNRQDALKEGVEEYGIKAFLVKNIDDDVNHTRNLIFRDAVSYR